ncbi:MAG: C25 family cysteine peptidase, partial [Planctomycetota bacterium]
ILLNNQSVATGQSPEFSVTLPTITSDRKESTASYVPAGWISPDRPATTLVINSGYQVLAGSANVLLLASGEEPIILRTALLAFPDIDAVDYFDCSITAPTVDDLISYDVVVAMSNSPYADAIQTGNALADYVDTGGKVIQAVATFAIGAGWELAGRFVTGGYEPFVHGEGEFFGHSLGSFDADHPIMDGVTTLTDGLPAGVSLQGGAEWVADWNNGTPLVATQGQDVVGVNIFAFDSGDFTGDVPLLFHNAIAWLLSQKAFEVTLPPGGLPITIPPIDSVIIDVNFVPTDVVEYVSVMVIQSNDEYEPEIEVQLSGTGITDYLEIVPEEAIEFCGHPGGPFVPCGDEYRYCLTNNHPIERIAWTVESNVSWLDVSPESGVLAPGGSICVWLSINAVGEGLPEDEYGDPCALVFTDVFTGLEQPREVNLEVFTAPKIWVAPDSFDVNVPEGGTITETLTIGNTGDGVLNFNITSREILPPEAPAAKSGVPELETTGETIILEYEFSEPVISKDGEYDMVSIEGLERYLCTGAPIVPVRPATVLIPFGKEVIATRVVPVDTRELTGTYQLGPAQKPYPLNYQGEVQATEPDPAIYEHAAPWPGIDYEIVTTQSKRGYQLLSVNLFPLQYSPATGEISYAAKLKLAIDLADFQNENVLKPSAAVRAQLGGTIDNPSALKCYPAEDDSAQKLDGQGVLPGGGPYQYVIITNEALEGAPGPWNFQALRDAKNASGMTATIVTTEWIYATYDGTRPDGGTDNQTRIRNFLIDAYQTWGTEYALLGGTNSIVPARMFLVDSLVGDIDTMPVDMYYGCVDPCSCTFDYDADGFYGEPTDGVGGGEVDLEAEIYVGRAAVENATEVENFIRKTLTYDTTQNEYLPRIAMVGEWLGFGGVAEYAKDAMEQIRLGGEYDGYFTCGFENHGQPKFIDFITVDCLPEDPCCCWPLYDADHEYNDWPKSDLLCLMSGGVHVFNHLGHANYTYAMKLYTSDLASLTNTDYFFIYSQGCMPGGFDTTNCFAEVITSMEEGAFAVVMNARYGWGTFNSTDGPSHRFGRQFWDAVLCEDMLEMGR